MLTKFILFVVLIMDGPGASYVIEDDQIFDTEAICVAQQEARADSWSLSHPKDQVGIITSCKEVVVEVITYDQVSL